VINTMSLTTCVKLLLVDDHPLLLQGVRDVLKRKLEFNLLGEASTGAMALTMTQELMPDLVIMDVHLPDLSGISITRQILNIRPSVKVLIFSSDADHSLVDAALEAGACGYIVKGCASNELLDAINAVMAGKLYLSPVVSAGILENHRENLRKESEPAKPKLSEQEKRLLRLVTKGHRNKEIAAILKLSPNSIETYRARLMRKVKCPSTAELVRYAIREGISPL